MNVAQFRLAKLIKSSQEKQNLAISLAFTQTSGISMLALKFDLCLLWNKVNFIDQDPHWYTIWVKKSVQL